MQVTLVEFLNENLRQPHQHIQVAATNGLRHMLFSYFPVSAVGAGPSERLQNLTVLKYIQGLRTETNVAATRGYALALGALPPKLVRQPPGRSREVFACLKTVTDVNWKIAGEADVETRRNAVESIAELGEKLALSAGGHAPSAAADGVYSAEVAAMLLDACEDYSVDKRGDTGSWCRIAGMKGLQRLLLASFRCPHSMYPKDHSVKYSAITALDTSPDSDAIVVGSHVLTVFGHGIVESMASDPDGPLTVSFAPHSLGSVMCGGEGEGNLTVKRKGVELIGQSRPSPRSTDEDFLLPSAAERRVAMLAALSGEGLSATTQRCAASLAEDGDVATWEPQKVALHLSDIDQSQVHQIIGTLLKQLGEKLDTVREVAGGILENVVHSVDPDIVSIPDRCVLRGGLAQIANKVTANSADEKSSATTSGTCSSHTDSLRWTQPKYVYTFLTGILDSNHYFAQVISGLVISIGGLSEGIVKESLAALLLWCNMLKSAKNLRALSLLASTLVDIFRKHSRDSRVTLPLLKCLSALLRNGIFDFLHPLASQPGSLAKDLHKLVATELNKCSDVAKIRAGIDLYLLLLMCDDPVRPSALKSLVTLCGHKYPKVRKYAAEQLYVALISDPLAVGSSREEVAAAIIAALSESEGRLASERSETVRRRSGLSTSAEECQEAMEILTATLWEDNNVSAARNMREKLAELLHVEITVSARGGPSQSSARSAPQEDALDSYDALVREAGEWDIHGAVFGYICLH